MKVHSNTVTISTSVGDLIDRITILKLKSERIQSTKQLKHINTELNLLMIPYRQIKKSLKNYVDVDELEQELMEINSKLWDLENQIRQDIYDIDIAKTAKAIIKINDYRSNIKYQINLLLNSSIIEEKSYF